MTSWMLASGNRHKRRELAAMLEPMGIELLGPEALREPLDVDERGDTFLANALLKAAAWAEASGRPTLADDSGLEVDALQGAPGVYSARFAGPNATDELNNTHLLNALETTPDAPRGARFRCVLVLVRPAATPSPWQEPVSADAPLSGAQAGWTYHGFSGVLEGEIARRAAGQGGFGYDPLFRLPDGRHLAELEADEKNAISHRGAAIRALRQALASGVLPGGR